MEGDRLGGSFGAPIGKGGGIKSLRSSGERGERGEPLYRTYCCDRAPHDLAVIAAGSRIRGVITVATPATRQQSGVIEVVFDRLTMVDGSTVQIAGKLTSTDSAERRQIKNDPNAQVVLGGARGGVGEGIAGAGVGAGRGWEGTWPVRPGSRGWRAWGQGRWWYWCV